MRENIGWYHGKRKDNNEWIEGYLFCIWDKSYILWGTTNSVPNMIEVIPETVGEYTGLTDKDGKKIWEGDIVREYGGEFAQGFYEIDRNLIVEIPNTLVNIMLGSDCGCKYKIIGNIHDNSELLK